MKRTLKAPTVKVPKAPVALHARLPRIKEHRDILADMAPKAPKPSKVKP